MLNNWPPIYMEFGKDIAINRYKTTYGMDIHTHNYFEIEYAISGKCEQIIQNKSYEFGRGDIAIFKSFSRHEFYASSELEMLKIIIKPECLPKIYTDNQEEFKLANIIHLPSNEVRRIENILFSIEKELNLQNEFYMDVIRGCLDVLFAIILRGIHSENFNEEKNSSLIDFKVFLTYIENNIKTVTPSSVAVYSGYNFPYFSKLFKKNVGSNLSEYINNKKLEMATNLLTETNRSIESIGFEVGFNHKSYFHRIFKRYYGVTPEEYRKSSSAIKKYTD